jgi:two-component system chemotaxis sensor kinase CheA
VNIDDEVFKNFLAEMADRLIDLEQGLQELENQFSIDVINKLFRAVHTIKGGCGFFSLTKITELSHLFEDILMKIREGELVFDIKMIPTFFAACDGLKDMQESEDYGKSYDIQEICADLLSGSLSSETFESPQRYVKHLVPIEAESQIQSKDSTSLDVERQKSQVSDLIMDEDIGLQPEDRSLKTETEFTLDEEIKSIHSPPPDTNQPQNETIRVKVDLLNRLMELTGEIVVGRNQLLRQFADSDNKIALSSMAHLISDLQQVVLQTRMQPIGGTFTKFNRIVRDLSKQVNKQIKLVVKGEETELDRSIIESLSDPLTHLIRNCCDHGIESSPLRIVNGKDPTGTIWLEAKNEGGQVSITIEDNGAGIDTEKVKLKALKTGLISPLQAASMSDIEAANLIFNPGLSTVDSITSLSGRGVGMDVVKSTVEKLGGVLDLETKSGLGAKITFYLPTTLAIMSSLIVRIGDNRFAIPHSELREVILIRPGDELQIEKIMGNTVYRLRGNLIPILKMSEITGDKSQNVIGSDHSIFLVLHSGANQFGLIVDSIEHTEEIVIKPLPRILNKLTYYAGSSILGDSDVAMVLSANGISQNQSLHLQELDSLFINNKSFEDMQLMDLQEKQDLLVFRCGPDEQLAIPLSLVFKIERIDVDQIDRIANKHFINLGDKNILLIYLDQFLDLKPFPSDLKYFFVITTKIDRFEVGIVASSIEESFHARLVLDTPPISGKIILGVTKLYNRITFILDLFSLAE